SSPSIGRPRPGQPWTVLLLPQGREPTVSGQRGPGLLAGVPVRDNHRKPKSSSWGHSYTREFGGRPRTPPNTPGPRWGVRGRSCRSEGVRKKVEKVRVARHANTPEHPRTPPNTPCPAVVSEAD